MASIKQLTDRKYKITVSNGYRKGKKICKAKTIQVPLSVPSRSIRQYVMHEAEELERRFKFGFIEDSNTTFQDYAEGWLSRQRKYAPSTLASYRRLLEVVYPFIGAIPLCKLRPLAIENMLSQLRKRKNRRGQPVRESTVQHYLSAVSAVLSDAKRNEIIQTNPARMIDLPATNRMEQHIPTVQKVQRLLQALSMELRHFRVFYLLAMATGCRRGELCALRWSDFRSVSGGVILTVSRSRSSVPGKGIVEGGTKNGRSRQILLSSELRGILFSYRRRLQQRAARHGVALSPYLFANADGTLIHPDTFTKRLRKIYTANGFPAEYHLHTLRHFFVSTLLHSGIDKQTVAELAGHGDTGFLERTYCHPEMERKQEAAESMLSSLHSEDGFLFNLQMAVGK